MKRTFLFIMFLSACSSPASPGIPPSGSSSTSSPVSSVNPSAAPSASPLPATQKILQVHPQQKACTGVAPMACLQVREPGQTEWTLFYSQIQGFTFEAGYQTELLVEVETLSNPPTDGSSLVYKRVSVLSKTRSTEP